MDNSEIKLPHDSQGRELMLWDSVKVYEDDGVYRMVGFLNGELLLSDGNHYITAKEEDVTIREYCLRLHAFALGILGWQEFIDNAYARKLIFQTATEVAPAFGISILEPAADTSKVIPIYNAKPCGPDLWSKAMIEGIYRLVLSKAYDNGDKVEDALRRCFFAVFQRMMADLKNAEENK